MSAAEHTPTPWTFREELGTVNAIDSEHSDGRARIQICDPSEGQTWNGASLPIDERTANGKLIVEAVNAHERLLAENAELRVALENCESLLVQVRGQADNVEIYAEQDEFARLHAHRHPGCHEL